LNNEFLQAQAQLNSLALGASRPQQQGFNTGGPSSYANRGSQPFLQGPNYGNKHNQHHAHQHGGAFGSQPLNQFHAGGNFGGSNLAAGATPQQMRFYSDVNNRDQRRELELFGQAHTITTGVNFDLYDDIKVEVTGNEGQTHKRTAQRMGEMMSRSRVCTCSVARADSPSIHSLCLPFCQFRVR
jgi:hypothetical protein